MSMSYCHHAAAALRGRLVLPTRLDYDETNNIVPFVDVAIADVVHVADRNVAPNIDFVADVAILWLATMVEMATAMLPTTNVDAVVAAAAVAVAPLVGNGCAMDVDVPRAVDCSLLDVDPADT